MEEYAAALKRKRQRLQKELLNLQKQIDLLDEMIYEAETGEEYEKKKRISESYMKAQAYMNTIKRLLSEDVLGKETKTLHHIIEVVTGEDINYNTFRSYLNRLKTRGEIHQDKNKIWHIKD